MSVICRFVEDIDGETLLDLNDETAYAYIEGSEFPLPDVLYEWVQNALGHGKRLAHWTLDSNKITLKLCIKGTSEQDAYDKLNVLIGRLLHENTLEVRMWGADTSVYYHTYPVTPKFPIPKRYLIACGFIPDITIEIPVDPEVKTSEEELWLIHGLGTNDDFERRTDDDFEDWEEIQTNAGTVTADTNNYHAGIVGCKLTTTDGGADVAGVRSPFVDVEETETHGFRVWGRELSGAPALDVDLICYDSDGSELATLGILTAHNPADGNWREVMNGLVVYPSTSGQAPRFPSGTTKIKRVIRNDATVASEITIDDLWFGSVERVSDLRATGAMGLRTLGGDVKGNLPALADVYITNSSSPEPWVVRASGIIYTLLGVSAPSTTVAFAVGTSGTILKTVDGGTTWVAQTSGTTQALLGVSAPGTTVAFVVGNYGTILKTVDGGTTWVAQTSGTTGNLRAVAAASTTVAFVVGNSGTILKTVDGGTTWVAQTSGTTENLWGVSAPSTTVAFAVGGSGQVVRGIFPSITMPITDITFGQSNYYSEYWNPILDAAGATQTALDTRRGGAYRQMSAGDTEIFRFNAEAHQGKHMLVAGLSFAATDAKDQFAVEYKLQTTGGTDITTQTTEDEIDSGFSAADDNTPTEWIDIYKLPAPRLKGLTIPSEGVSPNAELANIDEVVTVIADATLATTEWLDYVGLVPTGRCKVEVAEWSYNAMILDSRGMKDVLASLDGSLDTAQVYDASKRLGIPKFLADPDGCNFSIICLHNVTGDYQMTFVPDVKLVYNPTYLLVAST